MKKHWLQITFDLTLYLGDADMWSGSAKEYRNIVLLTKFLGEMKVIFSHHCCCDIFDSLITSITYPYLKMRIFSFQ